MSTLVLLHAMFVLRSFQFGSIIRAFISLSRIQRAARMASTSLLACWGTWFADLNHSAGRKREKVFCTCGHLQLRKSEIEVHRQ